MIKLETYKMIVENHSNGFILLDKEKKVIYANKIIKKTFLDKFNKLLGEYLGCTYTIIEKVHCQETTNCKSCIVNNCLDRARITGKEQHVTSVTVPLNYQDVDLTCKINYSDEMYILEFLDLDEQEKELTYMIKIMDKSEDLMFFKDSTLKYKYVNQSFCKMLKKTKNEIYGKKDEELLPEELYHQCLGGDLKALENGHYSEIEKFDERYYRVFKENIDDGVLGVAKDITEELKERKNAELDVLTGLFNRRKFLSVIDEIYVKNQKDYFLLLIDLDDLRKLNNGYGHAKGDNYLKKIGEILVKQGEGLFFRIGGDEFAGLINRNIEKIVFILKEIFTEIEKINLEPKLSVSIGVKKIDVSKDYLSNYSEVDDILYEVKRNGKGNYLIK